MKISIPGFASKRWGNGAVTAWTRVASRQRILSTGLALLLTALLVGISFVPSVRRLQAGQPGDSSEATAEEIALEAGNPGGNIEGGAGAGATGTATVPGGSKAGSPGSPGGPPGTSSPEGSVVLTASDIGVTAKNVRIGFTTLNPLGLQSSGIGLPLRSDIDKVIEAFVDYVNDTGGIHGRQVVADIIKVDPLQESSQAAACATLKGRTFGVVDTATFILQSTQKCFSGDGVPFTHSYPLSASFQAEARGYDVAANRNLDRIAKEWAAESKSLGFITKGVKAGVVTEACEPSITVVKAHLIPGIRAVTETDVVLKETDCNPAAQQGQMGSIVTQLVAENVTHVFMAVNYVAVRNFLENARPYGRPFKYSASDYNGLTDDFFTKDWDPDQWDGVLAPSVLLFGGKAAGKPPAEGTQFCSKILTDRGVRGLDNIENEDAEAGGFCDEFFIMVGGAQAVGPNLKRTAWAQAAQRLGTVKTATVHSVTFSPGKFSGGDTVVTLQWGKGCKCYKQISDYKPGRF